MPSGYYKDIIKILRQLGYEYERNAKGSHEIWVHPDTGQKLVVPRSTKSRFTANAILKDAGSDKSL
ncbi:type II toxin-antitoxin system HicA family toxin [Aquisalinus flavus]|uniref:Type II toxin-antitoxin system HicA family toxin n=1 Tax=Aquisalinus flavus TaxID=1526572 RepID=A0A8J2V2T0_9PROT|nr:type II toxin-antitoxin system HicA family toxin [Aquisalinus flavus]MBD0425685.1 type II toxin-antitoxin system HicA family toxin [Aquisalinus flavus]UNE48703.1 type II toxin-antitoxin system HicA family toxin [Aquisalinus flavus]GGD14086.1 hypothetical protein GCM10011342_23560 [Aquisalinus flavus]